VHNISGFTGPSRDLCAGPDQLCHGPDSSRDFPILYLTLGTHVLIDLR